MPTYIRLTNLTADGFAEIEQSASRTEQMKAMAEEMGGEIKDVFLTMGDFDFVTIAEFPNDQMYTQFALRFAEKGVADTETLKAIDEPEYLDLVQNL
ncbi:GYD family protein [Halodesulfurarchaeum formicicum]|uniref:GYD family protein n=1 Tax=Halodesulfurarchaeum formicicum TaxID=1873524 RepID=A0A1D8S2Q5_9EURY|nr:MULTISPECIES: GYD domain-containing protein [Halodesulfurarchaeum]AOW79644.1 GYD family protein [Halodesulfurarchaeum formicicum]MDR5655730.1 GYD domain-containing protein [Halodesulfurarchaeum sp. HSR-GB]